MGGPALRLGGLAGSGIRDSLISIGFKFSAKSQTMKMRDRKNFFADLWSFLHGRSH